MKFLHIADVHLGCTRYHLPESPRDFFYAWHDVLQRYAIDEKVDFVIMAGDFFHKRNVEPQAMNHAVAGLKMLQDSNIPAIAIEGNHDQHTNESTHSWLRSLSNWGFLKLLEPSEDEQGKPALTEWDGYAGSFIDIGNARIFGSHWYGASANVAIPMLTELIKKNRRDGAFHILMLHTDVEGHQTHPIPALTIANLKELKSVTDYIALGHTHKVFEIDNWAFNPGSLEVTNIEEAKEIRGAFLVEVGDNNQVTATHVKDYKQRPFKRMSFDVSGYAETTEITEKLLQDVKDKIDIHTDADKPQPIVEITLRGHLGFPNSLLEIPRIRDEAKQLINALHVRVRNHSAPIEYAVAADVSEDVTREKLERRVVEDLIIRDNRYKMRAEEMAEAVIGAKRMALGEETPEKIVDFIALKVI
jgi:DNA repair protein SbcD/Mre11